MDIIKSPLDKRIYKHTKLSNDLRVITVYDANTETTCVSLSVNAGSFDESDMTCGIAHLLEHMLFMGTNKYNEAAFFQKYINSNNGSYNAYTTDDITTYYFSIATSYAETAIDIFSQFFTSPIFSEEVLLKELDTVNSEYVKDIEEDSWKFLHMLKEISSKSHPFSRFSAGSIKALKGKNLRNNIKKFFDDYYSSNIMKLVIISNMLIDDQINIADKYFGTIKNKNVHRKCFGVPMRISMRDKLNRVICYEPYSNSDTLSFVWQFDKIIRYSRYKPLECITEMFENKKDGFLYVFLKKQGLMIDMRGHIPVSFNDAALYVIDIILTNKGFRNIAYIVNCMRNFISSIRDCEKRNVYDSINLQGYCTFLFEMTNTNVKLVQDISDRLHYTYHEYVLLEPYVMSGNYNHVVKIMNTYIDKMLLQCPDILIGSRKCTNICDRVEKLFHTRYNISHINLWNIGKEKCGYGFNINNDTFVNKYIPARLKINLVDSMDNVDMPLLINSVSDDFVKIYYSNSIGMQKPLCHVTVMISSSYICTNEITELECMIFVAIVNSVFDKEGNDAVNAGYKYAFGIDGDKMQLNVSGFQETMVMFLNNFFQITTSTQWLSNDIFDGIKENVLSQLRDHECSSLNNRCMSSLKKIMCRKYYEPSDLLRVFDQLSYESMSHTFLNIMSESCMSCMVNAVKEIDILNSICGIIISFKKYNEKVYNNFNNKYLYCIMPKKNTYYSYNVDKRCSRNVAALVCYHIGHLNFNYNTWKKLAALSIVFSTILDEKFYDTIRAKEKLGYVVRNEIVELGKDEFPLLSVIFFIQSSSKQHIQLSSRILSFVRTLKSIIKNIDDNSLKKIISTAITNINESKKNPYKIIANYIHEINKNRYVFDICDVMKKELSKLKKYDVEYFYDRYMDETVAHYTCIGYGN